LTIYRTEELVQIVDERRFGKEIKHQQTPISPNSTNLFTLFSKKYRKLGEMLGAIVLAALPFFSGTSSGQRRRDES